jgi:hypothetical protein
MTRLSTLKGRDIKWTPSGAIIGFISMVTLMLLERPVSFLQTLLLGALMFEMKDYGWCDCLCSVATPP